MLKKLYIRVLNHLLEKYLYRFYNSLYEIFHKDYIILSASVHPLKHNWGDDVSKKLIELICPEKKIIIKKYSYNIRKKEDILCIGSIITWMTTPKSIIWGSGVIYHNNIISSKPQKVLAVRGPLTRKYLLKMGVECPEIYGDPALLFPRYYTPKVSKKYKLGIVPHFRDSKHPFIQKIKNNNDVLIINVRDISPWTKFVDQIFQCENIVSSSLHGLIIADAYHVPNRWVEFDGGEKKQFAFHDYLESVGKKIDEPLTINVDTQIDDIILECNWVPLNIDLDKLMSVCPFIKNIKDN